MNRTRSQVVWLLIVLSALIVIGMVAIPVYVIRPFVPQDPKAFALALTVRNAAPWVSGLTALVGLGVLVWGWKAIGRGSKVTLTVLVVVAVALAGLTNVNVFEVMFKPYGVASFVPVGEANVDPDDKVLAVSLGGESHAFPIRTMGYHHIVNDVIGGTPIAATYCTLCHTGLIWSRVLDGRTLTFRLAGINNGNAVLRDEQTNSIWQQSTGEAIFGPLKGSHLKMMQSDELTFGLWRSEQPGGRVLKPEPRYEAEYEPKDWEPYILSTKTVIDTSKSGVAAHELMLGVALDGQTKAFPIKSIVAAGLIEDRVGSAPLLIVVGPDHASIRAFVAQLADQATPLTFVRAATPGKDVLMTDAETGSAWDFHGCAVSGGYQGRCLPTVDSHKDFWFNWMNHNPSTAIYKG